MLDDGRWPKIMAEFAYLIFNSMHFAIRTLTPYMKLHLYNAKSK
jgi:hypothetical protein